MWAIDLAAKASTFNTANVFTWDDASEVIVLGTSATLTVRGTNGRDDVRLFGDLLEGQPASRVTVDLVGGDDRLRVDVAALAAGSRMDAGMGRDLLGASSSGRLEIDLHDETIAGGRRTLPRSVAGFEDVRGQATRLTLTGNELNNTLRADACVAVARGRGGDDDVTMGDRPWRRSWCPEGPRRAEGGLGNDRLAGGPDREHLTGGPGIDQVNGGGGVDVCLGERRIHCEA
jgi:Ca2+-binding RTX toxin-like protein